MTYPAPLSAFHQFPSFPTAEAAQAAGEDPGDYNPGNPIKLWRAPNPSGASYMMFDSGAPNFLTEVTIDPAVAGRYNIPRDVAYPMPAPFAPCVITLMTPFGPGGTRDIGAQVCGIEVANNVLAEIQPLLPKSKGLITQEGVGTYFYVYALGELRRPYCIAIGGMTIKVMDLLYASKTGKYREGVNHPGHWATDPVYHILWVSEPVPAPVKATIPVPILLGPGDVIVEVLPQSPFWPPTFEVHNQGTQIQQLQLKIQTEQAQLATDQAALEALQSTTA